MHHEHYWVTNLLLADALANRGGICRGSAVKRCARQMRDKTKSEQLYTLATQIIRAPAHKVVRMTENMKNDMKQMGLMK